jgi:hypothetical protein
MAKKQTGSLIFANKPGVAARILEWIGDGFAGRPNCIVCVSGNKTPTDMDFCFDAAAERLAFSRALIIFEGLPIALDAVGPWREWAVGKGALELHVTFLRESIQESTFRTVVDRYCQHWTDKPLVPEAPALTRGQFIRMPHAATDKDDPSLLTMMFGSMGELLTAVDVVGRQFREAHDIKKEGRQKYLEKIAGCLDGKSPGVDSVVLGIPERIDLLPRLLLRGETGVGKTLIARCLHKRSGFDGRPLRISVPEYLGKEDMFEYDLFGYMRGAYTDAKEGSHGLLLENVGGVVFLDEIGEANDILQAKLLAYLDDYRVRPRKWKGTPFYCPTLIVAATNRDLDEMAENKTFRADLLARFTDRYVMPPLRQRMEDLHFILDCLLQSEAINPGGKVTEIGCGAFEEIKSRKFTGNFRELETVMRTACREALKDGRDFICAADFDDGSASS